MKIICAFSSDARELYKADIYRALSLPKGHILHFRYKEKYVDQNILNDHNNLKSKEVAIFLSYGNEDPLEKKKLNSLSIRKAKISHFEKSIETSVYHVYLSLDEFCNILINSNNPSEKMPNVKFLSELDCTIQSDGNQWFQRVSAVKQFFPDHIFFNIKNVKSDWGNRNKSLHLWNKSKFCGYNLFQGGRYIFQISIANPNGVDCKLKFIEQSKHVFINSINPLETSVEFDDLDIPISIQVLSAIRETAMLQITPEREGYEFGEYSTILELSLNLSLIKPMIFGFLSAIAFWALIIAQPVDKNNISPSPQKLIAATAMVWFSTGSLFYLFNKK